MTIEEADKILTDAVIAVSEHFDAVQIMATWCEEGDTFFSAGGSGNELTRIAMANRYLNMAEEGGGGITVFIEEDDSDPDPDGGEERY